MTGAAGVKVAFNICEIENQTGHTSRQKQCWFINFQGKLAAIPLLRSDASNLHIHQSGKPHLIAVWRE